MKSPTEKTNWNLASAKLPFEQRSRTVIENIAKHATRDFRSEGTYAVWYCHDALDANALEVLYAQVTYNRKLAETFPSIQDGLAQLPIGRSCRSLAATFKSALLDTKYTIEARSSADGGLLFGFKVLATEERHWPTIQEAFLKLNFVPSFESKDWGNGLSCYSPIGYSLEKVRGVQITFTKDESEMFVRFFDTNFEYPKSIVMPYGAGIEAAAIVGALEDVTKLLDGTIASVELRDRPSSETGAELPPPEGAWNCVASARYKPDFDPFVRPTWLNRSARYPLLQLVNDNEDLCWQVDVVHTEQESFYDIQSSEGREYLESFLKEHELAAEIWDGPFEQRWNTPSNPDPDIVRRDEEASRRVLGENYEESLPSLESSIPAESPEAE